MDELLEILRWVARVRLILETSRESRAQLPLTAELAREGFASLAAALRQAANRIGRIDEVLAAIPRDQEALGGEERIEAGDVAGAVREVIRAISEQVADARGAGLVEFAEFERRGFREDQSQLPRNMRDDEPTTLELEFEELRRIGPDITASQALEVRQAVASLRARRIRLVDVENLRREFDRVRRQAQVDGQAAAQGPLVLEPEWRRRIVLRGQVILFDGANAGLSREQSMVLRILLERGGDWVSGPEILERAQALGLPLGERVDRIMGRLPRGIQAFIERVRGRGSRLRDPVE